MVMSLDGVVSDVEKWADINSELMDESIERYKHLGTVIFGGATYAGMSGYWQKAAKSSKSPKERKLGKALNETEKIALTNRPIELNWENSSELRVKNGRELVQKIAGLKRARGKAIVVESGVRTWHQFLKTGVFDELHITVQPIIVGAGDKLFEGKFGKTKLQLVEEKKLKGGLIKLRYKKSA
jgi:dihydrofolate reductase